MRIEISCRCDGKWDVGLIRECVARTMKKLIKKGFEDQVQCRNDS